MNRECPFVGHRLSLGAGRKEEEKTASRAQTLGGKYDVDIVGKKHIASKQIAFAVEIFFFWFEAECDFNEKEGFVLVECVMEEGSRNEKLRGKTH